MSRGMLCPGRCAFAFHRFRHLVMAGILLPGVLFSGCRKPAQPVTITFLDAESQGVPGDHRMISDVLEEFTRETGIRVNDLATPEDPGSKLDVAMDLLRSGATSPDVYSVDTIWAGAMADYLLDLQPYFATEIPSQDPASSKATWLRGNLWQCPITRMWRFWFIGRTCSPSTATRDHQEPGMSLRRWPSGSKPGNGQKETRFLGVCLVRRDHSGKRSSDRRRAGVASSRRRRPYHRARWQDQRQ